MHSLTHMTHMIFNSSERWAQDKSFNRLNVLGGFAVVKKRMKVAHNMVEGDYGGIIPLITFMSRQTLYDAVQRDVR